MTPLPTEPDQPNALSRRTTPTWEMELLLSGAAVFAMVQLAQTLPGWALYLVPRLDVDFQQVTRLMFVYANAAVVVLALTFVLHLMLRAYWVGLVGMNSVYPGGMKWDGVRAGPIAKSVLMKRWPDMAEAIERTDNRATVVFGVGIGMALVFVPIMLVVATVYALAAGVAWLLGVPGALSWIFLGLLFACLLPYFAALAVDRMVGRRLRPGGWLFRATAGAVSAYSAAGMSRESNPLVTLYSTNVGERRGSFTVVVVMLLALGVTYVSTIMTRSELGPGSFSAFSDPRRGMGDSVDGRHYASRRDTLGSPDLPYLPDMVSSGKYVRLVVPYVPSNHGHLFRDCPAAASEEREHAPERARRAARLQCLANGFEVQLDGVPVAVAPNWYSEPRQDLRGLLYMIPADALGAGRHELSVMPRPERPPPADQPAPKPYLIAFWR